jgi:hypothetical protein
MYKNVESVDLESSVVIDALYPKHSDTHSSGQIPKVIVEKKVPINVNAKILEVEAEEDQENETLASDETKTDM